MAETEKEIMEQEIPEGLDEAQLIELLKAEKEKNAQLDAKNKTLVKQNYDLALNNAAYTETAPEKPKIERTIQEISKDLAEASFGQKDRMRCTELSLELDDAYLRDFGKSSYLPHAVHNNDIIFRDDITVEEEAKAKRARATVETICREIGTDFNTYNGGSRNKYNRLMQDSYRDLGNK
ncbi:MAG: hypothetical protein J6Y02_11415 [Pseudobutyrivibrio sp.]|nr:hypothetical protein [Pseudobutyrivibrio sp.]